MRLSNSNPLSQRFRRIGQRAKSHIDEAITGTLAIHPAHDGAEGDTNALLVSADAAISLTRRALSGVIDEMETDDLPPLLCHLPDAAFVARLSVGQLRTDLERARSSSDHWQIVRAASRVRRNLLRALHSLDSELCNALGVEAEAGYHEAEVEQALEARRSFNQFREDSNLVRGRSTASAMRAAAMSLAKLTCRGRWLRVYDRVLVADLRERMQVWLRQRRTERVTGKVSSSHLLEGKRLLGDYFNFVEMTGEVNKRPELIQHDAERVRALLQVWDRLEDSEIELSLAALRGRDLQLDELVLHRAPRSVLRDRLERVAEHLLAEWAPEHDSGTFPVHSSDAAPSGDQRSSVTSVSRAFARLA
ncbi:MAG: hypothetical protein KC766_07720 [Myxococcales bacterium]|nr:hypothetical protein [Myxococcales bacterium]